MGYYRTDRVSEEMKKEIADIIFNHLKDPRLGFITIVAVDVTRDYRYAKVYVSILEDEAKTKDTLVALNSAKGFIRKEVGKKIRLRYTPELIFELDDSIKHGAKISKILYEIERMNKDEQQS